MRILALLACCCLALPALASPAAVVGDPGCPGKLAFPDGEAIRCVAPKSGLGELCGLKQDSVAVAFGAQATWPALRVTVDALAACGKKRAGLGPQGSEPVWLELTGAIEEPLLVLGKAEDGCAVAARGEIASAKVAGFHALAGARFGLVAVGDGPVAAGWDVLAPYFSRDGKPLAVRYVSPQRERAALTIPTRQVLATAIKPLGSLLPPVGKADPHFLPAGYLIEHFGMSMGAKPRFHQPPPWITSLPAACLVADKAVLRAVGSGRSRGGMGRALDRSVNEARTALGRFIETTVSSTADGQKRTSMAVTGVVLRGSRAVEKWYVSSTKTAYSLVEVPAPESLATLATGPCAALGQPSDFRGEWDLSMVSTSGEGFAGGRY